MPVHEVRQQASQSGMRGDIEKMKEQATNLFATSFLGFSRWGRKGLRLRLSLFSVIGFNFGVSWDVTMSFSIWSL